ncbi:hypothetical protein [Sporosarcina sp. E16_8]|nr:hypothetical protein [Sporosarcina sp. E16_8]MBO0587981.1 hypothetical protein [Sporosarcina sp. E16_8]
MKESQLQAIHAHKTEELRKKGTIIEDVVYSPHKLKAGCGGRKPNSKLI